jgi:hypothetical protein
MNAESDGKRFIGHRSSLRAHRFPIRRPPFAIIVPMACPPNGLTDLLYAAGTPEKMVEQLAAAGCLASPDAAARKAVEKLIRDTLTEYRRVRRPPGPTDMDTVASALAEAKHLSPQGLKLLGTDTR